MVAKRQAFFPAMFTGMERNKSGTRQTQKKTGLRNIYVGEDAAMDAAAMVSVISRSICFALLVTMGVGRVATASEGAAAPTADDSKVATSSGEDFTGDRLVLKSHTNGLTWLRGGIEGKIALRGTILRVTQDPKAGQNVGALLVMVDTVPCVVEQLEGKVVARRDRTHVGVGGLIECPKDSKDIQQLVEVGEVYKIAKDTLEQYGYFRSGWVYGALLVPYKYHLDDKSFSSATTIGPYLGYRMGGLGVETALVGSIGLSSLSVANPNVSGDTSTIQGFTAAVGVIGGVNKNANPLRFGLMVGKDWAGSNSAVPYKHEGKTWLAVHIGFSFSE